MKTPAAVAVSLAALLLPAPAGAHFALRFDPSSARAGETVSVGFVDVHGVEIDVYLVPLEAARRFEPPPLEPPVKLVPVGKIGPAGLSFVVPDLPTGRYTTVMRRLDGRYEASTQPQLPLGVDPAGVDEAPDPAVLQVHAAASRRTAALLVVFGVLLLSAIVAAGVVLHRRWHDAVSG